MKIRCLTAAMMLAGLPAPLCAGTHGWSRASNLGRDILLGAALGVPAAQGDWHGDLQAVESLAVAGGAAVALKNVFPEERPDHSDRRSFPSGHSSEAFAAAATLANRYGWEAGLPAFALAGFVATARVEARKHYWHDVIAGATIGTASGLLLKTRKNGTIQVVPWGSAHGGGVTLGAAF